MLKTDVIAYFKSAAKAARALDVSHVAISKWGAVVPWGSAHDVEHLTGGAVRVRRELYLRRRPVSDSTLRRRLGDAASKSESIAR